MSRSECKRLIRFLSLLYPGHLTYYQVWPGSVPQMSHVWLSPSFMLLLSHLRPSSFLTWTAAWPAVSSSQTYPLYYCQRGLFSFAYPVISLSSSWLLWAICYLLPHLPDESTKRDMVFIILLLPGSRATSPTMHAPHRGSKLHDFLWTSQTCSWSRALLCMWNFFCLECLFQVSLCNKFPLIQDPRATATHAVHPSLNPSLVYNRVTILNAI